MQQYLDLLRDIQENGTCTSDRTGTGTKSVFGRQMRFDMKDGFPLLTTKKLYTRAIIHELLWMISGSTNVKYLQDNKVTIWDEWADEDGELGPVYGSQWRSFGGRGIDQLTQVINDIQSNPNSRRLIINSWNPQDLHIMALPPCHCFIQFKVYEDTLNLQLYQRSADVFLGVPFNIGSYALLLCMVAQVTNLKAGEFVHTLGDVHIYDNHQEQVNEQLSRNPLGIPKLTLNPRIKDIYDFTFDDIKIEGYKSWPSIKADVAV